ncbi:MAG: GGDEF domain-containing protein [Sneathiella sp.]
MPTDDFERVRVNAKKAMALMEDRGIRQTPHNYAIWFEYLQESNPDLTRAVNDLIAKNGKYTDKIGVELFAQFFTREKEGRAVQETSRMIQKSMDSMMGDLTKSSANFTSYGENLNIFAEKAEGLSGLELQNVIDEIVSQTYSMSGSTLSLQQGIDSASREIADLKRRLQFVQQEAYTDSLTGIHNRKSFDEELAKKVHEAQENASNLCLIMADIDHFKPFNDTHGHTFGDQVIKLVASTLAKGVSKDAIAARYGGEEFSVILPDTELTEAVNIANDLRMAISAKKIVKRATKTEVGKITMSLGVTSYAHRENILAFINRADQALYSAKNSGRNCVKHSEPILSR